MNVFSNIDHNASYICEKLLYKRKLALLKTNASSQQYTMSLSAIMNTHKKNIKRFLFYLHRLRNNIHPMVYWRISYIDDFVSTFSH